MHQEMFQRFTEMNPSRLKKGDIGENGQRFWAYRKRGRNRDGAETEIWLSEDKFQKRQAKLADWRAQNYENKDGIKRINPDTGDFFRLGDPRPSSDILSHVQNAG